MQFIQTYNLGNSVTNILIMLRIFLTFAVIFETLGSFVFLMSCICLLRLFLSLLGSQFARSRVSYPSSATCFLAKALVLASFFFLASHALRGNVWNDRLGKSFSHVRNTPCSFFIVLSRPPGNVLAHPVAKVCFQPLLRSWRISFLEGLDSVDRDSHEVNRACLTVSRTFFKNLAFSEFSTHTFQHVNIFLSGSFPSGFREMLQTSLSQLLATVTNQWRS